MKILLLGATGRTGMLVLEKAIDRGYKVNCLVRHSDAIAQENGMVIFEGDPANKNDLERAAEGCECLVSVLNISRNSDFPWSKLRTPKNYLSAVMSNIISIAEKRNIRRIITCSAWGVAETKQDIPKWFKWLIDHSNIRFTYMDHELQENLLLKSNLNWTIVRPTGLTNTGKRQKVRESFNNFPKPGLTISRLTVAAYLIDCITNHELIEKKVIISKD